jgi:putative transposase
MLRALRLEYEGTINHLMNRGDRHEAIFHDDADRQRFLETLGETCAKTDWQVHSFCLTGRRRRRVGGPLERLALGGRMS